MNEKQSSKKEDRRILLRFILFLIISLLAGFVFGIALRRFRESGIDIERMVSNIQLVMVYIVPILFLIFDLGMPILSFCFYGSAKKQVEAWDGEEEAVIDAIENKLNLSTLILNAMMVLNCLFFSVLIYLAEMVELNKLTQDILTNGGMLLFIAGYVLMILLQKKVVDLEKQLNPEKRGNVFDICFQRTWINSCDEAQKLMFYQAAYQAFRVTNITCIIFWLLSFIAQFAFHTGLLPVICVTAIWLVLIMTYSIAAYKLEKNGNQRIDE